MKKTEYQKNRERSLFKTLGQAFLVAISDGVEFSFDEVIKLFEEEKLFDSLSSDSSSVSYYLSAISNQNKKELENELLETLSCYVESDFGLSEESNILLLLTSICFEYVINEDMNYNYELIFDK